MGMPLMTEVFGLHEVDPSEPKALNKHPGQQMPTGMFRTKPQMQPPRSTPSYRPPEKPEDPATAFLRSKGALGGLKGPGSGIAPPKPGAGAPTASGGAQADVPITKPKYPGSFLGQTVDTGGKYVRKPVSWTDRSSGEQRYGGVQGKQSTSAVWDGTDWISPAEFGKKFPGKR